MELKVGGNRFFNTNGVLEIEGTEQISLKRGERDGQILLSMPIYDSSGTLIAKLQNNAWSFKDQSRYNVITNPSSLQLFDNEKSKNVVNINVIDTNEIQIPRGEFYTCTGVLVTITPESLSIGGAKMTSKEIDGGGCVIKLNQC